MSAGGAAGGDRAYDLVLFGATGFTGGLTAAYLARHAPARARWALAGRSVARLEAVRARLAAIDPAVADLPLLVADVEDRASIEAVPGPRGWSSPPSARTSATASRSWRRARRRGPTTPT